MKSGKVVQIMGDLASVNGRDRSEAFRACLKNYPGLSLLEIPAAWKGDVAATALDSLLTANPDVKAIYMQAGGVYLSPTLQTLRRKQMLFKAGDPKHVVIVSNDGIPQEFDAIRRGEIDATISQPADLYAKYGLFYIKAALAGQTFKPGPTDHGSTIVQRAPGILEDQLARAARDEGERRRQVALGQHDQMNEPCRTFQWSRRASVTKRFGSTAALKDVSIRVMPGESHALVGRNGAGKSTLVSMLTGLRKPDTGEVRFNDEPAPPIADRDAWRERVACVYQHSTIIRELVASPRTCSSTASQRKGGVIDWRTMRRDARALLDHWKIDVREDARAGDLTVEARQLVEIARALSYGARFIILDEPTAQLDGDEIKRLFRRIEELQREGVTFLFISHHLQEVYEICQAVTVLRDARHIVSAPVSALPREKLIEAMTGEQGGLAVADAARAARVARRYAGRAASRSAGRRGLRRRVVQRAAAAKSSV